MTISLALQKKYAENLAKAIGHLEKSYKKVIKLSTVLSQNDDDGLEVWESFTARFSRVVDIYTKKVLRAKVLEADPGFDGVFKDLLLIAEKKRLVDSADVWLTLRSLRNIQAHDYTDETFSAFAEALLKYTPILLKLKG